MAGRTRKRPVAAKRLDAAKRASAKKRGGKPASEVELIKMAILARRSGVPAPTIKHYIREGLLPGPPVRTSRNMAYYDARIAARIRVIKSLQAERFLPLRVIGELLEPAPSAALRTDKAGQKRTLVALAPIVGESAEKRRKRSDVVRSHGIPRSELDRLEKAGILELRGEGAAAGYSGPDLALLDVLAEVRRLGLGAVFPASIAETYRDAVEQLATMEIEVFRRHALAAGELPLPLPEVVRHANRFGERLVIALRAKLLPVLLGDI